MSCDWNRLEGKSGASSRGNSSSNSILQLNSYLVSNFVYTLSNFVYRVSNFVYVVSNFVYRVPNFVYRVSDFVYTLSNFVYTLSNFVYRVSNFGYVVSNFVYRVSNFVYRVSDFVYRLSNFAYRLSNLAYTLPNFCLPNIAVCPNVFAGCPIFFAAGGSDPSEAGDCAPSPLRLQGVQLCLQLVGLVILSHVKLVMSLSYLLTECTTLLATCLLSSQIFRLCAHVQLCSHLVQLGSNSAPSGDRAAHRWVAAEGKSKSPAPKHALPLPAGSTVTVSRAVTVSRLQIASFRFLLL